VDVEPAETARPLALAVQLRDVDGLMVRVHGDGSTLELSLSELGGAGTPADGDLLVNVTVDAHGFAAADQSWIVGRDWEELHHQARELDRTRRGSAVVRGASSEDLMIELRSTDSAGHMAIVGVVRRQMWDGFVQRLEFGFPFPPDALPEIVSALAALRSAK